MALPHPSVLNDWSAQIETEASKFRKGVIDIYTVDARDNMTRIIAQRPARIQQVRTAQDASSADAWGTKRPFIFETELRPSNPFIPKGAIVRVTDGGKDHVLTLFAYTVTTAINSSEAALRTIEAISELAPVPPVSTP